MADIGLATVQVFTWKDGLTLIAFGSLFLLISALEIMQSKRSSAGITARIGGWIGRLFTIITWLLMIYAGVIFILRSAWPG